MRLVWLSWYISGMLALLFLLFSLSSYAPGAELFGMVMQIVFASGALVGVLVTLWMSRFPRDHWFHDSKPLWAGFIVVAFTATVLVVLVG